MHTGLPFTYRYRSRRIDQTAPVLVPLLTPDGSAEGPSLIINVRGNAVALTDTDTPDGIPVPDGLYVGTVGGKHCWAVDTEVEAEPADLEYVDLMRLYAQVDDATWAAAGRAVQLVEWARTNRYCGRCGTVTEDSKGERARRCPACGLMAFPRLAPAVITLVERTDGRALLARNARWPTAMYSCLAGFVEPGESVEATVKREVHEEVGIDVGDVRYFRSQPWPFPHSLMLGFQASYVGGEINCDGDEIADAAWFAPDDLPQCPPRMSIARWLIDDWVARSDT